MTNPQPDANPMLLPLTGVHLAAVLTVAQSTSLRDSEAASARRRAAVRTRATT